MQFDGLIRAHDDDRRLRHQRVEVVETILDDVQQRQLEIVGQTRAVSRITKHGDASALGKAGHGALHGEEQAEFGDERWRQLIGQQTNVAKTVAHDVT